VVRAGSHGWHHSIATNTHARPRSVPSDWKPKSPGECRIIVDGQPYTWQDGEDLLFDETYVHCAENTTNDTRIILFCDVERSLRSIHEILIGAQPALRRSSRSPRCCYSIILNTCSSKLARFINSVLGTSCER
jgi:hypothetical protein